MRGYRALARAAAKNALTYRLAFFLSLFGVLFQFAAMLAVWRALLANSSIGGFTWDQMIGYLWVAFASGVLVGLFADFRMAFRIRNGMVALDIIKPVAYQEARFAEVLGALWIELLVVLAVGAIALATDHHLPFPGSAEGLLFVLSMVLLVPLKFLILYVCGLACFWTQNYLGVQWARIAVVNLLSGSLVPLAYLPHWLGSLAGWSPFAGMVSTPGLILIGHLSGAHAVELVAIQLGWVLALWFGAKALWRTAVRRLTVSGG